MATSRTLLRKDFVEQVTLLLLFPRQALEGQVRQVEQRPCLLGSFSSQG